MNYFVYNIKKRYFVFVFTLIMIIFFIVFLPMRNQLKNQEIENYNLISESKKQTVAELINSCISNAKSISSRTAIRDFILDYNSGKMSLEDLQELTYPKYYDGIKIINNLKLAVRYLPDRILVEYNYAYKDPGPYANYFSEFKNVEYRFEDNDGVIQIIVYSPILHKEELIGFDIIVVDISEQIRDMNTDGFNVKIIKSDSKLLENIEPEKIYEKHLIGRLSYVCVEKPINSGYSICVSKLTNEVFEKLNRVSAFSMFGFILGLALIFIILNHSLVKLANSMIQEIGSSRDTYMKYANYDLLTGAYTRLFFSNWVNDKNNFLKKSKFSVVMIDVDDYKSINDTYGHKTGDDVLKFIASVIMSSMRENDFVVRFGGDEFVVALENVSAERGFKIFERINKNMKDMNKFGFNISISYGIEESESLDDIYEAIKKADEKMYISKKEKAQKLKL